MALTKVTGQVVNTSTDLTVGVLTATTVAIGGTLTYEDVTNVDSVGLITARSGVKFGASGTTVFGNSTGIGINSTSPQDPLDVAAAVPQIRLTDTSDGSYGQIRANGGNLILRADEGNTVGSSVILAQIDGDEKLRIDSSGRLLLGTTTEGNASADNLTVADSGNCGITIRSGTTSFGEIYFSDATSGGGEYDGYIAYSHSNRYMAFATAQTERLRIDNSGSLLVNTSTSRSVMDQAGNGPTPKFQIEGEDSEGIMSVISAGDADANRCGTINLGRHRNGTIGGTPTIVQDGDALGAVVFSGGDGGDMLTCGAKIHAVVDGAPGANDMPGALIFSTTPDGQGHGFNTEKMRIASNGDVGIGIAPAAQKLQVHESTSSTESYVHITNAVSGGTSSDGMLLGLDTSANAIVWNSENTVLKFATNNTERMQIDSSGRMGLGTNSPGSFNSNADDFVISNSGSCGITIDATSTTNSSIYFADGPTGTEAYRGYIEYSHQADRMIFGTSGSTRLRIESNGHLTNKSSNVGSVAGEGFTLGREGDGFLVLTRDDEIPMHINRLTSDGNLVRFYAQSNLEGSISVSGSTVSYNGAHLSRWSQLVGISTNIKSDRPTILRGSVLSNLDEMCEWGDENNEQLNRMKVSDVEGDINVAGVFQDWDDDDDTYTNDFYCAMTGDFVIRIASGVTVQRGNLLMSAGDGTAKPQGDGYIQDKTIAKVISTTVSTTYSDGSYCVPCVLMAC